MANYKFKTNSNIDAYGDTQNVIHFKFGDARKQYNFTTEFRASKPGFCKEYANYWAGKPSKFRNVMEIVNYIDEHELPIRLYSNFYDEEFADIAAAREWISQEATISTDLDQ